MAVEIVRIADAQIKNPIIVAGFPGAGLVGSIAASYLVEKAGFRLVGYVMSNEFAPLAAIHNYTPLPPVRMYFSRANNIVAFVSEIVVPVSVSNELAIKIIEFAEKVGAKKIITLGGITLKEGANAVYAVGNVKAEVDEIIARKACKGIKEGATTGVTGTILAIASGYNLSALSILAEANPDFIDPKAAANALQSLSKVLGLSINTLELEKEAKDLTATPKESAAKSKAANVKGPEGGMYG
jgi:uncharacterized protein